MVNSITHDSLGSLLCESRVTNLIEIGVCTDHWCEGDKTKYKQDAQ